MCDCGKPAATEARTGHDSQGADAKAAEKSHAHAAPAVAHDATDAACSCSPSGTSHHGTHAGTATHA